MSEAQDNDLIPFWSSAETMYKALLYVAESGHFECWSDDGWDIVNNALDEARGKKND